jgi:hypothetical protein
MAYQVTAGRFVGRTQELARLREVLARATTGEPLVVLVGGEAGVGKTRLVERLAATTSEQGVRVLRGGCVPLGEEGVPFVPVIQALRGLAAELDPAALAAVAGPAREELGRLVLDLAGGGGSSCCWGWSGGWPRRRRCCGSWRTCTGRIAPPATWSPSWPPISARDGCWWW